MFDGIRVRKNSALTEFCAMQHCQNGVSSNPSLGIGFSCSRYQLQFFRLIEAAASPVVFFDRN
jgi:hypothetical protein